MTSFGPLIISLSSTKINITESKLLKSNLIGGVILFAENIESESQLKSLIDTIKSINPNIILYIDQEGGRVRRLKSVPPFDTQKSQYEYVKENNLNEYIETLKSVNSKLLEYGIHVNFAPTLDSNYEHSPIIGSLGRSFSQKPKDIYSIAKSVYLSQREIKMPTVAKHFPDHGNTVEDSHLALPSDNRNINKLMEHIDVYHSLVKEDLIDIIMPAHIIYNDIDKQNPATLSEKIITNMIRKDINFDGVLISDCIAMGALRNFDKVEVINRCIEIGFDAIILSHQAPETTLELCKIIKNNTEESKSRISKLLAAPTRGLPESRVIDIEETSPQISFGENQTVE